MHMATELAEGTGNKQANKQKNPKQNLITYTTKNPLF